jgi:hypothetical protein
LPVLASQHTESGEIYFIKFGCFTDFQLFSLQSVSGTVLAHYTYTRKRVARMTYQFSRRFLKIAGGIYLLFMLCVVTGARAADYFTYYDPAGKLVISNKEPPPGSKIIKKQDLPDVETSQKTPEAKEPATAQEKENGK